MITINMIGKGFRSIGAGLKTGSLTNSKVLRGIAVASAGFLGTRAMFRHISQSRERAKDKIAMMRSRGRYSQY